MTKEHAVLVSRAQAEDLSDFLMDQGAWSVSIEDADAGTTDEKPLFGEPGMEPEQTAWDRSRLKILTDGDFDIQAALEAAAAKFNCERPQLDSSAEVPDCDWVRLTQSQFSPVKIDQKLWIVPTWHEVPDPQAISIRLDPGVAFGTGTHPTTRMCLEWLCAHDLNDKWVLDYGCGSGILAVSAKKLGASVVCGTDIDPQAVQAAKDNAQANEAKAQFFLPNQMPEGQFDVVIANILSNPLRILAPALLARVAPGGSLVLSGILERQAQELIDVYRQHRPNSPLSVWKTDEGWVCLTGTIS